MNRKLQTAGVTTQLSVKYRKPVPAGNGVILEIRARLKEMKRNFAFIEASISHEGQVCSTCEMVYFTVSKEKASSDFFFNGCLLEDE